MNKKSVEGLPLQYLIIILIAVIVIGIIMNITGVVDLGVRQGLGLIGEAVNDSFNATFNSTLPQSMQ
ncbi:MAG: hypothetical protein PHT91_01030 [Candidatus Nanoarchaeia archaeon]|nr:hypothetical protein [Candidatus Nanoarchaeia archaeon]MDD5499443.1 hypothetical protein [Candidatus Nanoarchaeia archaeon]